jgi:hypothetical protein
MKVVTTELIENIIRDYNMGLPISRKNKIFYQNQIGTLTHDVGFLYTHEEKLEFAKCSNDIHYFIEQYCGIKLIQYQKDWIDDFKNNRFLIYCISRQLGYSTVMSAVYLHYMIFNADKSILLIGNKGSTVVEFINKIYRHYFNIPYFLKPGIQQKELKKLKFNNGCRIVYQSVKNIAIGFTPDILSILEFAHIPNLETIYSSLIPIVSSFNNTKLIIQSQPNGYNKFIEILQNAERKDGDPLKNNFKTIRTYWWEFPGRDDEWKQRTIKELGSEKLFQQEYDLQFIVQ